MKFARYEAHGEVAYGVVENDIVKQISTTPFDQFQVTDHTHQLSDVRLLAPCTPAKIVAIGRNYISHLRGRDAPERPEAFFKVSSSIIGPGEAIILPQDAGEVHEEAELVAVIGKRCKKVTKEEALDYILGYTCGNDVSAREWQSKDLQWWRAKSSDTFSPFGPFIVTGLDPFNLELKGRINGKEVQGTNTSELHFDLPTMVSFISQVVTLEPGDLLYTGTPGATTPLQPGDTVEVEISGIGVLSNPVRGE